MSKTVTCDASALESPPPIDAAGTRDAGFAARLREATKVVHREAERSGVVADLIRGRATRESYAVYLRNLVPVYAKLEARLAALDRPSAWLAPFADPALRRLPYLLADLAAVAGPAWAQICPLLPEAEIYAGAITEGPNVDMPPAVRVEVTLAAHAYARYLGDLSGGQILQRLLTHALGLKPDALSFYAFPACADVETAKTGLREALDIIPPTGDLADAIIAETISAFRHNIALSTAVSDTLRSFAG